MPPRRKLGARGAVGAAAVHRDAASRRRQTDCVLGAKVERVDADGNVVVRYGASAAGRTWRLIDLIQLSRRSASSPADALPGLRTAAQLLGSFHRSFCCPPTGRKDEDEHMRSARHALELACDLPGGSPYQAALATSHQLSEEGFGFFDGERLARAHRYATEAQRAYADAFGAGVKQAKDAAGLRDELQQWITDIGDKVDEHVA
eukprot:gene26266-32553_t